jgi:CDP-diacylglycerol--glycerol-3-phosphate 3-phosphatidyltransferase
MCVLAHMNLPNALTVTRIFLVPLLVVVLLTKFEERIVFGWRKELVAAAIFALASFTDWLDGYLARRRKQVTPLGQVIDPLADKLLTSAAFLSLVQIGLAPAWMVAIIIGRELAVTGLRGVAQTRGLTMPASGLGKLKMASQVVAVLLLILAPEVGGEMERAATTLGHAALWIVLALALWSAVEYYQTFTAVLSGRPPLARETAPAPDASTPAATSAPVARRP